MSIKHISDYKIQEYIDNGKVDTAVKQHLSTCKSCTELLSEYETCFLLVEKQELPGISDSFITNTMAAVKGEVEPEESKFGIYVYLFVTVIGLLAIAQYFLRFSFDISQLSMHAVTKLFSDWTVFSTIKRLYDTSPEIISILLFAGITLLFYSIVDKLIKKADTGKINCLSI